MAWGENILTSVRLYNPRICPFAHRVGLALQEKGINCEIVEVDLEKRPDWFMKLAPTVRPGRIKTT